MIPSQLTLCASVCGWVGAALLLWGCDPRSLDHPDPYDTDKFKNAIRTVMNISAINSQMQFNVSDKISLANIKTNKEVSDQCIWELGPDSCACRSDVTVEASLSWCTGLGSIQLVKWELESVSWDSTGVDSTGKIPKIWLGVESFGMIVDMKMNGNTKLACQGRVRTVADQCNEDASGTTTAEVEVNQIVAFVDAKPVKAVNSHFRGQLCLKDFKVTNFDRKTDITQTGFGMAYASDKSDKWPKATRPVTSRRAKHEIESGLYNVLDNVGNTVLMHLTAQLAEASLCFDVI